MAFLAGVLLALVVIAAPRSWVFSKCVSAWHWQEKLWKWSPDIGREKKMFVCLGLCWWQQLSSVSTERDEAKSEFQPWEISKAGKDTQDPWVQPLNGALHMCSQLHLCWQNQSKNSTHFQLMQAPLSAAWLAIYFYYRLAVLLGHFLQKLVEFAKCSSPGIHCSLSFSWCCGGRGCSAAAEICSTSPSKSWTTSNPTYPKEVAQYRYVLPFHIHT